MEYDLMKQIKAVCQLRDLEEIDTIEKFLQRLRGYGCGYHKQLEKQMLNRIKDLRKE